MFISDELLFIWILTPVHDNSRQWFRYHITDDRSQMFFYFPVESMTFQRAPFTFAQDAVCGNSPRTVGTNQNQIRLISFPDKSAITYLIHLCRSMRHLLYYLFDAESTLVCQFEHTDQRELYGRMPDMAFNAPPSFHSSSAEHGRSQ